MTTPATGTSTPVVPTAPVNPGESAPVGAPPAPAPAAPAPAAAPAPTPAAAPAAPAPDLTPESDEGKKGEFTYQPTGDNKLDLALNFVGKHGFGHDHPAIAAASKGDFSILKAQLAEKQVPGFEAYIALAESAYERITTEHAAKATKDKEDLHKYVGGEESWNAITEWAKTNADEGERTELSALLGKGGVSMKIAAGFLASQYQRATGGVPLDKDGSAGPAVAADGVRGAAPGSGSNALSPRDYGLAVATARSEHRGRESFESSPVYEELKARRMRFKG